MELSIDQLIGLAESGHAEQAAQWIADQGLDRIYDPASCAKQRLTFERALIELLSAGVGNDRMRGIELFERRVRRIWEQYLEQYAHQHEHELTQIALDARDEALAAHLSDGRSPEARL
ncbi:MAG: hypothetical protein P9M14_12000 [Candidatus Alcyoniella australis]|nr:hypothetical protein [Candidatus Alcyoniella australis]